MKTNKELSNKFGFEIKNSLNKQFPYYVVCCDECMTLDEIEERADSIRWNLGIDNSILTEDDFAENNEDEQRYLVTLDNGVSYTWNNTELDEYKKTYDNSTIKEIIEI